MTTEVKGNIFNFIEEGCILLHQVNCQGVMGGGIAKQIKELFPNVYLAYKEYCIYYKRNLLGAMLPVYTKFKDINFTINNCFGQRYYGRDGKRYTDYISLRKAFKEVVLLNNPYSKILIPKYIGCGLAGGDWDIVSKIIEEVFMNYNVLIVDFDGSDVE